MNWFSKIKAGLSKSSDKISTGVNDIFTKRKLNNETLEELEDLLITTDIGVKVAREIITDLAKEKFDKEISPEEVKKHLATKITSILNEVEQTEINVSGPKVIMMCGVNGNGKTTSIGKLAYYYQSIGKKVMMAACDTFRAAAVEQLEVWANRNKCPIVIGKENADPASVAFVALERAKKENIDILIIDTAGRLQNKANLMEELAKFSRVLKKLDESAPHETILVLDGTTGQNAHSQLEKFKEVADITSIIVTKLDGTTKAGVIVALANKFKLPIKAIGVGENIDDLQPFNPEEFTKNLVGL